MSKPPATKNTKTKTAKPVDASKPGKTTRTLTLKTPKLLFPTFASLLATGLIIFFIFNPPHTNSTPLNILIDMFQFALIPLVPTLGLFLLHRLLEVVILHRAFRPIHLLSVVAIIFAACVYCYVPELLIINSVLYLLATTIFAASLSFQKSHSLATDPAHFRSSLLSTAVTSAILGLINIFALAAYSFSLFDFAITGTLLGIAVVVTLPLQLTLIFLCITKLATARTASLPTTNSDRAAAPRSASFLSHFDLILIGTSFAFSLVSSVAYLAVSENIITEDYSRRQPCCHQPTYYED